MGLCGMLLGEGRGKENKTFLFCGGTEKNQKKKKVTVNVVGAG